MRNKEQKNNLNKKSFKNFRNYTLVGICAVLAILSIFMTIETATVGAEMSKLEKTQGVLLSQKSDLEETLVKTLSITELQQKSTELGFVKASDLVYVTNGENNESASVAKLP